MREAPWPSQLSQSFCISYAPPSRAFKLSKALQEAQLPPWPPKERPPFLFPDGIVFDIAFSKDGQTMAIACEDKAVRIYDWKSGKLRHTLSGHDQRVWATAFAPDGKTLAACTGEYRQPDDAGEIKIWNLATGKEETTLTGHRGLVFAVAYSPDGKTLFSASWDKTVK